VRRLRHFRKVLERKDIDAVLIATPDHGTRSHASWRARAASNLLRKAADAQHRRGRRLVEEVARRRSPPAAASSAASLATASVKVSMSARPHRQAGEGASASAVRASATCRSRRCRMGLTGLLARAG
jgi:hypothetical protein